MLRVISTPIHSTALIATSQVLPAELGKIFPSSSRKNSENATVLRDHDIRILAQKIYIKDIKHVSKLKSKQEFAF